MKKRIHWAVGFLGIAILAFVFGGAIAEIRARFFSPSGTSVIEAGVAPTEESAAEKTGNDQDGVDQSMSDPAPVSEQAQVPSTGQSEDSFSFAILGDTQRFDAANSAGGFQQAVRAINGKDVDFVMTVGDLLSSCDKGCAGKLVEWQKIIGLLAPKTYAVMGNHDRTGRSTADEAWQKVFEMPTNGPAGYSEMVYSFDFKNTHFVVLNSEKPKEHVINKTQRDWLESDLGANKKENILVFYHEPAYPVSSKIGESLDFEKKERDEFWNILTKYQVTAVFNGHEHIFSRRKIGNIYQFVVGNTDSFDHDLPKPGVAEYSFQGKSFAVVKVTGRDIFISLYSVEGKLTNEFGF
ncbi:MAG: metallophosphoesterase [Parcubacteria group bacterium]